MNKEENAVHVNRTKRITVNRFFGEKKVTLDEFIDQWLQTGGVNQLWRISNYSNEHKAQIEQIKEWVSEMAKESLRRVWNEV